MNTNSEKPGNTLTLETMRADIAQIIDLEPSDVGDDDNLMDLGLDSMRMMNLVVKWSEMGFPFEFADLAEYLTLKDWWEVIERLKQEKPPNVERNSFR